MWNAMNLGRQQIPGEKKLLESYKLQKFPRTHDCPDHPEWRGLYEHQVQLRPLQSHA